MAYGGYRVSLLRAQSAATTAEEALAHVGGETSSSSASVSNEDNRAKNIAGYRLSSLSVLSNVALHVKDHYVDPTRIKPRKMLVRALEEVERQTAEVLVETLDNDSLSVEVMGRRKVIVNDVENLWEINLKLREVFRFLEKYLPPQDDVRLIEYAAVNGALSTLDPHSILLKPAAFAEMKTSTKGEFGGLGIVISIRDEKLTIISPIDGTPASRAGLKAGDVISRIGDVSTVSMPVDEAVRMLRGPKGSEIVIWVDRDGWATPKRFPIVRERIKLESVESKLLSSNVGYIKIKNFQQNTGRDLEDHLQQLVKKSNKPLQGLVLDLRNNPGGLLEQATRVSDKFISAGEIVTTVGYGNKLREPKRARWSGTETDLPIAVLVNRGSASASEIVAGALKNLNRATIIGETTFGKGSVQVLYDFADNSALKLTIAQYLTPGDISIQNTGVTPDIALRPAWLKEKSVRMFYESNSHRESALEQHLDRANDHVESISSKSTFSFPYLVREDNFEETEEESEKPNDFPIEFARNYLISVKSPHREQALKQARALIRKTVRAEEKTIRTRLATLGVDWTPSPKKTKRPASLNTRLELKDAVQPGVVKAGNDIALRATVTNTGMQPVFRVHGTLKSEHVSFEGREMLFGMINPGESKTWTIHTSVPRNESARTDKVTLELESDGSTPLGEAAMSVRTELVHPPQFAFTWTFDDRERGDGDGRLEVGEGIDMAVFVTNIGHGTAGATALRLRSAAKEDLFLERGRVRIGEIASGATQNGTLAFRIPEVQSGRESLPLELAIYDSSSGEWLEAQFDLKLETHPKKLSAQTQSGWIRAKHTTVLRRSASPDSPVVATLTKGEVLKADAKVGPFIRVELGDKAPVFVSAQAISWMKNKKRARRLSKKTTPAFQPWIRPPHIAIADEPSGQVSTGASVQLQGKVSGRTLRDMYVLHNDDKIFFQRAAPPPSPALTGLKTIDGWAPPNDDSAQLPFSFNVDLQDGLNKIMIVARLNETVISRRTLFVYREDAKQMAKHSNPVEAEPQTQH